MFPPFTEVRGFNMGFNAPAAATRRDVLVLMGLGLACAAWAGAFLT
jgi:hypothetical protein